MSAWAVNPEDQARQDREYHDYQNLLTLIEGASSERLGSVALRVKRFITPESNIVYAQDLVYMLERRALRVIDGLDWGQEPAYSRTRCAAITSTVLEVGDAWETMVHNVSDQG